MKNLSYLLIIAFALSGCGNKSVFKRTKTLVELSQAFNLETSESIRHDASDEVYSLKIGSKVLSLASKKIIAEPLIVADNLYFIDEAGNLGAFSLSSKQKIWKRNFGDRPENNHLGGGIEYSGGTLYVTNGSRFLIMVDSSNGAEIVRKKFPDLLRTKPTILKNGIVMVQTVSNQIFGYDPAREAIVWRHESLAETLSSTKYIRPIEYKNYLIASYTSGIVFAVDLTSGAEKWTINLANLGDYISLPGYSPSAINCDPIIEGDHMYIASSTGKLWKINMETGRVVWTIDAPEVQSMSKIGKTLLLASTSRKLAGINMETGKVNFLANLFISKKTEKEPASFLKPFLSQEGDDLFLNVASDRGELYRFAFAGGDLSGKPTVTKIPEGVRYEAISEEDRSIYLLIDKSIIYNDGKKSFLSFLRRDG